MLVEAAMICLAMNVYHEARGEDPLAQLNVAQVVMNRVADKRFPSTVCEVVLQGGERRRDRCQFSWYCDGKPDTARDARAWDFSMTIAKVTLGGAAPDFTNGALYYHTKNLARTPSWAFKIPVVHWDSAHVFFRPEK